MNKTSTIFFFLVKIPKKYSIEESLKGSYISGRFSKCYFIGGNPSKHFQKTKNFKRSSVERKS